MVESRDPLTYHREVTNEDGSKDHFENVESFNHDFGTMEAIVAKIKADHEITVEIPVSVLLDLYDQFKQLTKLGQSDIETFMEQSAEVSSFWCASR